MRLASSADSASRRSRSPITWRWLAMRQTATRLTGLGREVVGCGARQVHPPRIHPGVLEGVARERRQRQCPRAYALQREGARTAVPDARYAPDRHETV